MADKNIIAVAYSTMDGWTNRIKCTAALFFDKKYEKDY